ncbi:unnamed protein product [Nippostrongylus brasiliensis]|uniref:Sushi domain-containing protein n=1 Tax=Nippostrongylus brasiliensis TaxID=27835 RepID=A0A0N4Y0F6_NIPBR|nr:unnamed protein product [Nippostrongylus brasiliensis]
MQYECLPGWKLIGEERRRCQFDGTWSGTAPHCKVVDCEAPPAISNGEVSAPTTTFDSQANYTCHDGYRLIGHGTVKCTARGMWEPAIPVCYDMATLRELRTESSENHTGLAALGIVLGFVLLFVTVRFTRNSKTVSITDKHPHLYGSGPPPGLIYVTPSMLTNGPDSVVYYASSGVPLTKMEIPPHLLSLKQLPNGNIQATMPIGRPLVRPQLPIFSASPTPSQLLYSFDYEPVYDVPPDVQRRSEVYAEENIYEKLPDVRPNPQNS